MPQATSRIETRGTTAVAKAFLTAAGAIPEEHREAVISGALAKIRDELQARKVKAAQRAAEVRAAEAAKAAKVKAAEAAKAAKAKAAKAPAAKPSRTSAIKPEAKAKPPAKAKPVAPAARPRSKAAAPAGQAATPAPQPAAPEA